MEGYSAFRLYHAALELMTLDYLPPDDYTAASAALRGAHDRTIPPHVLALETAVLTYWEACRAEVAP